MDRVAGCSVQTARHFAYEAYEMTELGHVTLLCGPAISEGDEVEKPSFS